MCNRTRLILLGLVTGVLCVGCGADSSGYPEDFGAGGSDVASGGSSVKTVSESSSGSNGGSPSSSATECPVVEAKACVPGASVACACPDGSSSSQVCSVDGASFGACQCETAPVEPEIPAHYVTTCTKVGPVASVDGVWVCGSGQPILWVGCETSPPIGSRCEKGNPAVAITALAGSLCCFDTAKQ